jgi:menaquinone-dependent protoporphyrinogen IX oxidase
MNEPKLKPGDIVYSTRYALTCGISKHTVSSVDDDGWVHIANSWRSSKQGGDYHATLEAAQERARKMAKRKLAALDKQRAALEAILRDGAKVKE